MKGTGYQKCILKKLIGKRLFGLDASYGLWLKRHYFLRETRKGSSADFLLETQFLPYQRSLCPRQLHQPPINSSPLWGGGEMASEPKSEKNERCLYNICENKFPLTLLGPPSQWVGQHCDITKKEKTLSSFETKDRDHEALGLGLSFNSNDLMRSFGQFLRRKVKTE